MPASQEFHVVPIDKIIVAEDRARKEFGKIEELADSIRRLGLLSPIIVDRKFNLRAGERRLRACKLLGLKEIAVHYHDELDPYEAKIVELEENLRRLDMTWQETALLVAEYHEARTEADEDWVMASTGKALGLPLGYVSEALGIARALKAGDTLVAKAETHAAAKNLAKRRRSRIVSAEAAKITGAAAHAQLKQKEDEETGAASVFVADFVEWAESYEGRRFNVVHCDFPYGIGYDATKYGGSSTWAKYKDSKSTFDVLLSALLQNKPRIFLGSAHLFFWFSMNHYTEIFLALTGAGFAVNAFPLIWYKDRGIIPDPNRGPRRIYETAFFASLGDRKIIKPVPNLVQNPIRKATHLSEKPRAVLAHFFRMFVDDLSEVLDPTCGSGNALVVAKELGARRVVGLDIEKDYVEATKELLRNVRTAKKRSDDG